MLFVINLTILLSELFSKKLTKLQQDQLNLFVTDLSSYFESLTTLVTDLYQEKKCFLYSTGKDNYDDFSNDLTI